MKKFITSFITVVSLVALTACGSSGTSANTSADTTAVAVESAVTYKIGLCNYVDDASLNQIVANIKTRLSEIESEEGVTFEIIEDNCNADQNLMTQIISNFQTQGVDLMIGVATPVAMAMQAATEDEGTPIVFAAVSDPVAAGIVESIEAPGANITGTSDYLDTDSIMNLIFAMKPEASQIALLYDIGQDSSTTSIAAAKAYLDEKGVAYQEYTATNVSEVQQAAAAIAADQPDAVFTPSDNTIMQAELAIYETLAEAGVPHFAGADSFALNGAFLGYGVDYANLGRQTAQMVADILVEGNDPATTAVQTFDNGTATINTEVCEMLSLDYDELAATFEPYCTQVVSITTAEEFE